MSISKLRLISVSYKKTLNVEINSRTFLLVFTAHSLDHPLFSLCLLLHYRFLFARLVNVIDKKGLIDARNAIVRFAVIFNIAFMN